MALFLSDSGNETHLFTLDRSLASMGTDRYNHVNSSDGYLSEDAEIRLMVRLKRVLADTPANHPSYGVLKAFIEHMGSVHQD
jgi:hypothetical protein